jgi:hypothetical protein
MPLARFVRTLGILLMLGLAGAGAGCGAGSSGPTSQEESERIRESKKKAHQQIKEQVGKGQGGMNRRGPAGRGAGRGAR